MSFKEKSITINVGIIGAIILPLFYVIPLLITGDPDFILFANIGLFRVIFWLVQWISFMIRGWILSIINTVLLFIILGYLAELLFGLIVKKIKQA